MGDWQRARITKKMHRENADAIHNRLVEIKVIPGWPVGGQAFRPASQRGQVREIAHQSLGRRPAEICFSIASRSTRLLKSPLGLRQCTIMATVFKWRRQR